MVRWPGAPSPPGVHQNPAEPRCLATEPRGSAGLPLTRPVDLHGTLSDVRQTVTLRVLRLGGVPPLLPAAVQVCSGK